eukprot:CAMPEP_0118865922 /NCGR_PEP_ID=MMETSP1163-20130328/10021_1 /TAXON_ID=124430 /ORGANISM="Phaeomonas parva, Strain CCMP2877" /LENGTH=153 /DNA_ID=CAMNT_0006800191 /DNA_START=66 /DNA_END=525 /DNA_ORIENTATION=-
MARRGTDSPRELLTTIVTKLLTRGVDPVGALREALHPGGSGSSDDCGGEAEEEEEEEDEGAGYGSDTSSSGDDDDEDDDDDDGKNDDDEEVDDDDYEDTDDDEDDEDEEEDDRVRVKFVADWSGEIRAGALAAEGRGSALSGGGCGWTTLARA